jgi:DNA helicase-2/ATP-dependent DNA helicase PcrA
MTPVHLFPEGDDWVVHVAGNEERFGSRPEAFRAAKDAARRHTPSRIVNGPPRPDARSAAKPVGSDDATASAAPGPTGIDDPTLAHLGPKARAAFVRARAADASDPDEAGWGRGGPAWDGDTGEWDDPGADGFGGNAPLPGTERDGGARRRSPSSSSAPSRGSHRTSTPTDADRSWSRPPPAPEPQPVVRAPDWTGWGADDAGWSWERLAGPAVLGRSIVLSGDAEIPEPWADAEEVFLGEDDLDDPVLLDQVRAAFLARVPMVYRLDEPDLVPAPATLDDDVWRLPVDLELGRESLWHLLLANSVDGRDPDQPVWPLARAARDAGAARSALADVALLDGRVALCDGGPLHFWSGGTVALADGTEVAIIPRLTIDAGRVDPLGADEPEADLAPDQLASVGDDAARSRIVAPAGSGKTRVLTERARYLIRSKGVPARSVCLVAFNKRAQEEMRDRTRDLPGLQIQTLNALALSILNGGGTFGSRGARVSTIDELQVRRILSDMVKFPRRANTDPAAAWLDALSMVRLGLRDPAEVEAEFNGDVDGFADFFDGYRAELRSRGSVDFDDQIYSAIEALLREPETRAAAQASCRVLLVDEFQDLTPAHLLLIRLLAGPEADVFGVGDDDQTIYGYSGASPDWLIEFDRYFPGATHHALEVNYRCPTEVVTAASNLLSHNRRRVAKQIRPGPHAVDGDALRVVEHSQPVVETAAHVAALVTAGVPATDIIVLARVNTLLAPVQVALHEAGIPVLNREGGRFLERTGVAAALSWVRLATRSKGLGGADIDRAARRPGRSLSPRMIEWMSEQRDTDGLLRLAGRVQEKDRPKIEGFVADIERIRTLAATATTDRLLEFVRTEIGLDRAMQTLDSAHRGRNSAAHSDDLRALIALGTLHPDPTDFEPWLRTALDGGRDDDGVQLSTVHRVKGLEWPHVVVHDASSGSFPHRLSTDVEEERRVFHVAITRGQREVLVVADAAAPSLFLREMETVAPPVSEAEVIDSRSSGSASRSSTPRVAEVAAAVGLEVEWGGYEGEVVELDSSGVVLAVGRARFTVAYGSSVRVGGKERRLGAPGAAAVAKATRAPVDASAEPLVAALKQWRATRAKADGVPAYVVAKDATLEEIATVRPTSPQELLAVNGIGPAKLERYGDEILAVLDDATA